MNWMAFRIVLDLFAIGLFMLGLAYWWLDNTVHELAGTALFSLLVLHVVFNRRWWRNVGRPAKASGGLTRKSVNLALAMVMIVLLATSVIISRWVFSFLTFGPPTTARQIHIMAAYWALVAISIHFGMHWSMIIDVARRVTHGKFAVRYPSIMAHAVAAAIAATGIWSSMKLGLLAKLLGIASLDYWDFNKDTAGFFLNHLAVVGLGALVSTYGLRLMTFILVRR